MFLYGAKIDQGASFAPTFDGVMQEEASEARAAERLWNTTRDLQLFRDNSDAASNAGAEAYERRNREIFEATGVQLANPYRLAPSQAELKAFTRDPAFKVGQPAAVQMRQRAEAAWRQQVEALAREKPELGALAGGDMQREAYGVAQQAERDFSAASADPAIGGLRYAGNLLGGGVAGMLRDPMQVMSLFVGGGVSAPARTVVGRVLQTMLSEAVVNGGVEAGLQLASQDWRKAAGVESGIGPAAEQVGLAALFGGGFGGLLQGAGEVFRLLGREVPADALARAASGEPQAGDMPAIAEALGLQLDPQTARVVDVAAEQAELDRAAFGPAPVGLAEADAETLAAQALRSVEDPADIVPQADPRAEAIDRIVRQQQPLGPAPRRPVTLMQFLASRSVGGIRDDGGELAAMGLSQKFVPGGGALVRGKGKTLDYAREAAAEAGYFDAQYGTPERAIAESTTDDLLRLLRQEAGGEPALSPRNDGGRQFEWLDFEQRQKAQNAYRQLVEQVDSAIDTLGIDHRLDDALLIRAAELVDDQTDAVTALERAIDEDYRNYADAISERGEPSYDDSDIPFFEDTGPMPGAGDADGRAGGEGAAAGRGGDAPGGPELSRARDAEGTAAQPLRAAGDTPEPASPEAGEIATLALTESRRGEPETTDSVWDAMPAATKADGTVEHVTHAQLIEDAERDDFFGDLIAACKD